MKEIRFEDSIEAWSRWVKVVPYSRADCRELLTEFLGQLDGRHPELTEAGYAVNDLEYKRMQLLLGPHYVAIIKAWMINHG